MKHVAMYLTDAEWVLTSMSRTTAGVWVANLVIHRLAHNCSDEDLGGALLAALEASALDVPHPASWPEFHRKYRASLGVVSYERFLARCRLLNVHLVNDTVLLAPHRNRGPQRGFEPLAEKKTLPVPDAPALGQAVREWSERCR
jgi:hypothetical protein